jgi:hypothetical protein
MQSEFGVVSAKFPDKILLGELAIPSSAGKLVGRCPEFSQNQPLLLILICKSVKHPCSEAWTLIAGLLHVLFRPSVTSDNAEYYTPLKITMFLSPYMWSDLAPF